MRQNRSVEENDKTYFRSKRIYSTNGYWYFDTREGKQFGPYLNRSDAEIELAIFFAQIIGDLEQEESKSMNTSYGNQDGIELMVEELIGYFNYRKKHGSTSTLAWASIRLRELEEDCTDSVYNKTRLKALKYVMNRE
jgi:hypothetical protein